MKIRITGMPQGIWPIELKKHLIGLVVEAESGNSHTAHGLFRGHEGQVYLVNREVLITALQVAGNTSWADYWVWHDPLEVLRFSSESVVQVN